MDDVCMYVRMCRCVCIIMYSNCVGGWVGGWQDVSMCVRDRERERERERVCVCQCVMCVCVSMRRGVKRAREERES